MACRFFYDCPANWHYPGAVKNPLIPALLLVTACTATPTNAPPVVGSFTGASNVATPNAVTFAWELSDPDGDPLRCALDTNGDGTAEFASLECSKQLSQSYTYPSSGSFTAKLSVSDGQRNTVSAFTTLVIASTPVVPPTPPPIPPTPPTPPPPVTPDLCGVPDIGGWTVPTPSPRDTSLPLRDLQQPGSRLYYISAATGNDATAEIYFWDGSRIVDSAGAAKDASGAAYGSDPMNPSAAVKAFKRWAYVGPRQDGSDIGSPSNAGSTLVSTRGGFPDWWLFKRGETFDLSQDFLSFARENDSSATSVPGSLAVSGGRSATERQIVGAYGDPCADRPRFVHPQAGFITRFENVGTPVFKNVAYLSLHFDGHDRLSTGDYAGLTMLYQNSSAVNLLFEDDWFDATSVNISQSNGAQVTLRRSLVTDSYKTDGNYVQGVFYEGSRDGKFRIEESLLMRNGFSHGDPKTTPWPPSGSQVWAKNGRNMYLTGQTSNMNSGLFDSVSMLGGSGDQIRAGMRVERNFVYQGYFGLGAYGGYPDGDGPTGTLTDNILQRFVGTGTDDNTGQPGWGIGLTSGASGVEIARNIVTSAQYAGVGNAFGISPLSWVCYAHVFHYPTRGNNLHDNILESPADASVLGVSDGVTGESTPGCANWQYPGVQGNTVANNVMISGSGQVSGYGPVGAAVGTTNDTIYTSNKIYPSRDAAATALGWTNPNRTLKTYLLANGISVSSPDGFPEYFALATGLRRGLWQPKWSGKAINNHVRTGFGLTALP